MRIYRPSTGIEFRAHPRKKLFICSGGKTLASPVSALLFMAINKPKYTKIISVNIHAVY